MRRLLVLLVILVIFLGVWVGVEQYFPLAGHFLAFQSLQPQPAEKVKIVTEESVTINAVKQVGPSVVTVVEEATPQSGTSPLDLGPFSILGIPTPDQSQTPTPQSIGSGFIVSQDGLIVTNKHVVSDTSGKYQVVTADSKKYDVKQIYRDPLNDIAILRIDPAQNSDVSLKPVTFGDSSHLQVGQFVIAIGTALGQFRNTVTTGVVSGLGRGITAGDQFQGYVEQLDNVIQTSAAINPGNSGGPLLNSGAQVIGINTAVAQNGQNIGFALPISVVQKTLSTFSQTGGFTRNQAYMGVEYTTLSKNAALLNNVPQGAYVQAVVSGSPADKAGITVSDIITRFDGKNVGSGSNELAVLIAEKKSGDSVSITVWSNGNSKDLTVDLGSVPNQ